MVHKPRQSGADRPTKAVANLAELLVELDQAQHASRRTLRRLDARVARANEHRRRLVQLSGSLLRVSHAEELAAVGAEAFDIAAVEVDAPYEGLLVALVRSARAAGAAVEQIALTERVVRGHGPPAFASELLHMNCLTVPAGEVAEMSARNLAVVADAERLATDPTLLISLQGRTPVLIVLLDAGDRDANAGLRATVGGLADRLESAGFELLHVSGAGDQIAFARRGLLAAGRRDGFSRDPA